MTMHDVIHIKVKIYMENDVLFLKVQLAAEKERARIRACNFQIRNDIAQTMASLSLVMMDPFLQT